jgi:hypothetical protein
VLQQITHTDSERGVIDDEDRVPLIRARGGVSPEIMLADICD